MHHFNPNFSNFSGVLMHPDTPTGSCLRCSLNLWTSFNYHGPANGNICYILGFNSRNKSCSLLLVYFLLQTQSPSENWTDDLPVCKLSGVGFLTNQRYREDGGRREEHEFEDRSFHFNIDGTYLYGVFDGHDGCRASDFAVQRIPAEFLLGQLTGTELFSSMMGSPPPPPPPPPPPLCPMFECACSFGRLVVCRPPSSAAWVRFWAGDMIPEPLVRRLGISPPVWATFHPWVYMGTLSHWPCLPTVIRA